MDDELDELNGLVDHTRTHRLGRFGPRRPGAGQGVPEPEHGAIDHNLYVKGDTMYQSNYTSGLRVLDITDPVEPEEVGFFDTVPFGDETAGSTGRGATTRTSRAA